MKERCSVGQGVYAAVKADFLHQPLRLLLLLCSVVVVMPSKDCEDPLVRPSFRVDTLARSKKKYVSSDWLSDGKPHFSFTEIFTVIFPKSLAVVVEDPSILQSSDSKVISYYY